MHWLKKPAQGRNLAALRQLAASGVDVPALRDLPVVRQHEHWVWMAFCALSEKRMRIDGTPQPIPVSEILSYTRLARITEEVQVDLVFHVVSALDSVYMQHYWTELERRQKK